jgi:hypothetical protein
VAAAADRERARDVDLAAGRGVRAARVGDDRARREHAARGGVEEQSIALGRDVRRAESAATYRETVDFRAPDRAPRYAPDLIVGPVLAEEAAARHAVGQTFAVADDDRIGFLVVDPDAAPEGLDLGRIVGAPDERERGREHVVAVPVGISVAIEACARGEAERAPRDREQRVGLGEPAAEAVTLHRDAEHRVVLRGAEPVVGDPRRGGEGIAERGRADADAVARD